MRSVRQRIDKLEKSSPLRDAAYRSLCEKAGGDLEGLFRRTRDRPRCPMGLAYRSRRWREYWNKYGEWEELQAADERLKELGQKVEETW